jgi:hypothetical protein
VRPRPTTPMSPALMLLVNKRRTNKMALEVMMAISNNEWDNEVAWNERPSCTYSNLRRISETRFRIERVTFSQ